MNITIKTPRGIPEYLHSYHQAAALVVWNNKKMPLAEVWSTKHDGAIYRYRRAKGLTIYIEKDK